MTRSSSIFSILFFACMIQSTLQAQFDPNARDLVVIAEWFEGEFDSDNQIWFENRYGWKGNPEERHNRIHTTHDRLTLESLGDIVFYVEESVVVVDSATVQSQRVVSFKTQDPKATIGMEIYHFKNPEKYVGGKSNPNFKNITMTDLVKAEGCTVEVVKDGKQYEGKMPAGCSFDGSGNEVQLMFSLSDSEYWKTDRTLNKKGKVVSGHINAEPHKLRKANTYDCDVSFYEFNTYTPSEKDIKYPIVKIHDQGGIKSFKNPINGKMYTLQLRNKKYPFYQDYSDFLMMRFKEVGIIDSKAIVTGAPETPNLSFQLGWVSCRCRLPNNGKKFSK